MSAYPSGRPRGVAPPPPAYGNHSRPPPPAYEDDSDVDDGQHYAHHASTTFAAAPRSAASMATPSLPPRKKTVKQKTAKKKSSGGGAGPAKTKKAIARTGKRRGGEGSGMTKLRSGASAAFWASKAFQVARICVGDFTQIAPLVAELVGEGLLDGAISNPDMVMDAITSVFDLHGGLKKFRTCVSNFSVFSRDLAKQFKIRGDRSVAVSAAPSSGGDPSCVDPRASQSYTSDTAMAMANAGASMEQAGRIYRLFTEADTDGSGSIDLEEFVQFCRSEGVPRSSAEVMFFQADIDGNGSISFEEWTKMMIGRVGRDKSSFNCAGHHGLTTYTVPFNGLACDWCAKLIPVGSIAAGCRRCDCDACGDCLSANRPSPKEAGGGFNCRERHGLALFFTQGQLLCDWCHGVVQAGRPAVGCRLCDCDGCMECAARSLESYRATSRTCKGRHGLLRNMISSPGYACDICRAPFALGAPVFFCGICSVDVCVPCMWRDHRRVLLRGRTYSCDGNHEMRALHIMSYADLSHRCDWCLASPRLGDRMMRCHACDVDVCNNCLSSRPPPPPPYDQHCAVHGEVPSRRQPPPPRYRSSSDSDEGNSKGGARRVKTVAEGVSGVDGEYSIDSIVRLRGVEDPELNGKLMTVVGFEPDSDSDEDDIVVLQRRGMVIRAPSAHVHNVLDG